MRKYYYARHAATCVQYLDMHLVIRDEMMASTRIRAILGMFRSRAGSDDKIYCGPNCGALFTELRQCCATFRQMVSRKAADGSLYIKADL